MTYSQRKTMFLIFLAASAAIADHAAAQAPLAVVAPVVSCESLAQASLRTAVGVEVQLQASPIVTSKGTFCHVTGAIAPSIHLEVDLPQEHWTQRFLQAGCGGLCGSINASIGNAGTCQPALNGEFVVAATDMGHQSQMGAPGEGSFASDPQKRIDFAYRANHLTALAAKALITAYYGQAQRYSYFSGCSDGGREAMMEAERFPEDFDGISAGAPAFYFQVQNSFNHAWTEAANTRADGTKLLQAAQLQVLHAAVIDHCDTLDGVKDGLLSDPRACKVQPEWVRCKPDVADQAQCLTAEQLTAAKKLYEGPTDAQGKHYLPGGWQPGSELQWAGGPGGPRVPAGGAAPKDPKATAGQPGGGMLASMAPVVFLNATPADETSVGYPFTEAQFHRAEELHTLNDAVSTDLRPFAGHGGKLLMYHGWSDTSIAPMSTVAYYMDVERDLGTPRTAGFVKLFMIPGMGHCGGGDGFPQFDTLTPLMAWVETGKAPAVLVADRLPATLGMTDGPDGRGGGRQTAPYAKPNQAALASRPLFPFPSIAHTTGADLTKAASFVEAPSDVADPSIRPWTGSSLMNSKPLPEYIVVDGKLRTK